MKGEEGAGHIFIYLPCREVVGEIHACPGCVLAARALEIKKSWCELDERKTCGEGAQRWGTECCEGRKGHKWKVVDREEILKLRKKEDKKQSGRRERGRADESSLTRGRNSHRKEERHLEGHLATKSAPKPIIFFVLSVQRTSLFY